MTEDTYISVDIEASGPIPGEYSMLSFGACVVGALERRFYVELKPITRNFQEEALAVAGLTLDHLERHGTDPAVAMLSFEDWIATATTPGTRPVFVAYPIAFDWMFVAYYFHRFLQRNPFGIAGVDVKSFYAGMTAASYSASGLKQMEPEFTEDLRITHNALDDALAQAVLFERLLARRAAQSS